MKTESAFEQEKLSKLRKMRIIAASVLVLMAIVYITFKPFEAQNIFFSSIVAFAEAAMIGALADWFAVVALFRHPMGMRWIPHTAIIPNNKNRIGESISNFVVSSFFTEEVISTRLERMDLTSELTDYVKKHRGIMIAGILTGLPGAVNSVFDNGELLSATEQEIKRALGKVKLYPLLGSILHAFVSSGQHLPLAGELLVSLRSYIGENKEGTLKFLEGLNKTLSLPLIGDIVYWNILKTLDRQIEDIESNADTEVRRLLLYSLPRMADRLKTSGELIEKGEKFKNEVLESEMADSFIKGILSDIKAFLVAYSSQPGEVLTGKLDGFMDKLLDGLLAESSIKEKINHFIRKTLVSVISTYKEEISKLIKHTVEEWEEEDMVNRLEMHVGADLQFIRINGTVVGGLAGLAIHLLSGLF